MFEIPSEKLPDFLKDEKRTNVLFAPLRNKGVNPKDWDNKISSWRSIIKLYCECNNVYSFTLSSLNSVFIRNGRPPSCLAEVLIEMERSGEIQISEVFLKRSSSSWSGWATELLIKRPISWSYNKIKKSIFAADNIELTQYVHLEVIKLKSDELVSLLPQNYKNKLINLKDLLVFLQKDSSQVDSIRLLLHNLLSQHKIDITKLDNRKSNEELEAFLIKFGDGKTITPISEIDIGIYTLEKNEKLISKNIEYLEDDVQKCVKEAKMHLSKNHRQMVCVANKSKRKEAVVTQYQNLFLTDRSLID